MTLTVWRAIAATLTIFDSLRKIYCRIGKARKKTSISCTVSYIYVYNIYYKMYYLIKFVRNCMGNEVLCDNSQNLLSLVKRRKNK